MAKEFDREKLVKDKERVDDVRNKLTQFEADLRSVKLKVQHCQDKIDNLKDHEYDPNCKYCTSNVFVKDAIDTKVELVDDKKTVHDFLQKIGKVSDFIEKNKFIQEEANKLQIIPLVSGLF